MLRPPTPLESSHLMLMGAGRSGGGGFVGPLDDYTANLAGAWSVARRLLSSYTGPLIRIRRSSDSVEWDIGYDADGNLDTAAITSFVGANSAYVVRVYGQDSSGLNYVNTTASTQPLLVNTGTLNTLNGVPALLFETSRDTVLTLSSTAEVATWMTTARLLTAVDYAGLITAISVENVLIGNAPPTTIFTPAAASAQYYVDSVDKTGTLSPFGYDPHCFTVTTTSSLTRTWLWGSERNIAGRFFDGPAVEQVFYSTIPAFRADVETELMNLLGL